MLVGLQRWHRPATPAAAVRLLARGGKRMLPVAGATALFRRDLPEITDALDLTALPLHGITAARGALRAGAAVTVGDLLRSPHTVRYAGGVLQQCALAIGTTLHRNVITLGGNCAQCFFWSALPVAALALGARFTVVSPRGTRRLTATELFARPPQQVLGRATLITHLEFPRLPAGSRARFRKVAPNATAFAYVQAAVVLRCRRGSIAGVQAALGGLQALPQRFPAIEKSFAGRPADAAGLQALAEALVAAAVAQPDMRVTADYKRALMRALLCDLLGEARDA